MESHATPPISLTAFGTGDRDGRLLHQLRLKLRLPPSCLLGFLCWAAVFHVGIGFKLHAIALSTLLSINWILLLGRTLKLVILVVMDATHCAPVDGSNISFCLHCLYSADLLFSFAIDKCSSLKSQFANNSWPIIKLKPVLRNNGWLCASCNYTYIHTYILP
ncbi:uncharacterized protein LOC119328928 [Triticum dicoccoides]|uniref:uncharacterized protein LOC119328928 n=1 Tax=Triticum dicoccoides TaxID=85692 RepID=UPI001891DD00|nr:uncharacterized protein LOC119328928 [Triticum dicoccoides]XP_044424195.1 uncharacterized protein LOC123148775 [Triticum aestivum]